MRTLALFCIIFLSACTSFKKEGAYVTAETYGIRYYQTNKAIVSFDEDNITIYETDINKFYAIADRNYPEMKLSDQYTFYEKGQKLTIYLPKGIGSGPEIENNDNNFEIFIEGSAFLTNDFNDNAELYLERYKKLHKGKKSAGGFYSFPVKIKDMREGKIIIKYKGIEKEISFIYNNIKERK